MCSSSEHSRESKGKLLAFLGNRLQPYRVIKWLSKFLWEMTEKFRMINMHQLTKRSYISCYAPQVEISEISVLYFKISSVCANGFQILIHRSQSIFRKLANTTGLTFTSCSYLTNCCGEKQEHITSPGSLFNASNDSSCHMPVYNSKWEARWLTRQTFLLICIYSTHARCSSSP